MLEKQSATFIRTSGCNSCHSQDRYLIAMQSPAGNWTTNEGRRPPMNAGEYQAAALAIYSMRHYAKGDAKADQAIAKAPSGKEAPAAKGIHHAYLGGLLEHSLSMARVAEMLAGHYQGVDRSLLIAGALLHDLGKTAVPNGIWEKRSPLSQPEWERVRLHPYMTERILSYSAGLRGIGAIAGAHHERLDGSGYHRGSTALSPAVQILAAADCYRAMGQTMPYRPPLDERERERELLALAEGGRLDATCVRAVLEAAGHAIRPLRQSWPAGLTEREVEVLRLIVQGHSNRSVAQQLTISPKTVGRHIENIYAKTGVSSRATAALFAMQPGQQVVERIVYVERPQGSGETRLVQTPAPQVAPRAGVAASSAQPAATALALRLLSARGSRGQVAPHAPPVFRIVLSRSPATPPTRSRARGSSMPDPSSPARPSARGGTRRWVRKIALLPRIGELNDSPYRFPSAMGCRRATKRCANGPSGSKRKPRPARQATPNPPPTAGPWSNGSTAGFPSRMPPTSWASWRRL